MRSEDFIKCFVRLKPILLGEMAAVTSGRRDVTISKTKEVYSFSEVFSDSTDNEYIFRTAVEPIMSDLFDGYSACVLAYGQTSSGKTYTMKGVNESLGLIPLSIKEIFGRIGGQQLAKVSISYFEIYNENIIDLLSNEEPRYLQLREDGRKNLAIVDLIQQDVMNEFEAIRHYSNGEMRRKFASNNINFASSRSHTIFKVTLSRLEGNKRIEGSIYMVDLAGSESISKTNAVGVLKKEAENINKSLLALTTAIRAISERQAYVNYRNSKLTRILQPSLSGSSKTVVICTVKQSDDCIAETINTLKFGISASTIRTDAKQRIVQDDRTAVSEVLEEERAERAKLEVQLAARGEALESRKLEMARLEAELEECKHRLFALENENRHNSGLIDHYRSEQQAEKSNRNVFYQRTEESIAFVEQENRNLKATIHSLNETIEKRNKMVSTLEKNERTLLDKVEKYQRELDKLQKMFNDTQNEQRSKASAINNPEPAAEKEKKRSGEVDFHSLARRPAGDNKMISSAFTIGKVVDLSTTVLSMKIDMNHYLTTISQLHEEVEGLQRQLEREQARKAEEGAGGSGRRESVGSKAKDEEKRMKQEIQKLKQKNNHYMKIIKKSANNNIETITGFNEYLDKNFGNNKKQLFKALFEEDTEDYEPYEATANRPRNKQNNSNPNPPAGQNSDSETNNPPS